MGIKAAQVLIQKLKASGSLSEAYEFLRNFPDHSVAIATSAMSEDFKAEVEANAKLLTYSSGLNSLLINNRPASPELTVFDLSRLLRAEYRLFSDLMAIGLTPESTYRVMWDGNLHLHTEPKPLTGVLKTGPETGRIYLNDLEEDKKYSDWSNEIEDMFLGNTVVALNLYTILLVGDVKSEEFWKTLHPMCLMYQANWPIRFGLILTNPANTELNALLIAIIKRLRQEDEALPCIYLSDLTAAVTEDSALASFSDLCYKNCAISKDSEALTAKRAVEFCKATGVCEAQILLNGRLIDTGAGRMDRVLIGELGQERQLLGFLMYNRALRSPLDRFFEEGKHSKVIERLNPCITVTDFTELTITQVRLRSEGFLLQNEASQVKKLTIVLGVDMGQLELLGLAVELLRERPDIPIRFRVLFRLPESGEASAILYIAHLMAAGELDRLAQALSTPHLALETPENQSAFTNLLSQQVILSELSAAFPFVLTRGRLLSAHCFHHYLDFELLLKTELSRLSVDADALEFSQNLDEAGSARISDALEKAGTLLMQAARKTPVFLKYREFPMPKLAGKLTSIDLSTESPIQVLCLLNPLKLESPRILRLLTYLQTLSASIRLILNPQLLYAEGDQLPQRWYGYNVPSQLEESLHLHLSDAVTVTLSLDIPEKWLVYSIETDLDPDNLRTKEDAKVVFGLEGLVIDGSCAQLLYGYPTEPPAGLQVVLSSPISHMQADTIVMQNIGYYQFRAEPGLYSLALKQGRSSELFEMQSSAFVVLDSLTPDLQHIAVSKIEGKEEEQLLGESAQMVAQGTTIHVFTLASGHLYERLMRIMVLSVLSHTTSPVKFWILANFLSPKFRQGLPALAEALGFDYELVTYAWPFWLFPQKEKQRLIWAYKVLFLDVLFPLSVPKIIYIDADQVVRSDIKELWEMDLQKAPYAYTPFCDSNRETEGYRFWKSGFWKKHLSGHPYHISALYVVDLNRFRSLGAGDSLRFLYANMARDPNSLANLDQDLPNYAQHQVPIFSLPQDWLWCATWCDLPSLATAKTIDLCNNPLTKEPKIQAAKRLIPEWSQYDQMLQEFDKARSLNQTFTFTRSPDPPSPSSRSDL